MSVFLCQNVNDDNDDDVLPEALRIRFRSNKKNLLACLERLLWLTQGHGSMEKSIRRNSVLVLSSSCRFGRDRRCTQ